jgi:RNA polymerase sigma-70 factor (ECF subfamily)
MTEQLKDDLAATDSHGPEAAVDSYLLHRLQTGDEAALAALYDRYGGLVYTLALRIVGDAQLAQEVLQDTFLRCWERAERYDRARGHLVAWLMGVARNRAIDLLRSRAHQARLREQTPLPEAGTPREPRQADSTDAVLLRQVVGGALAALPAAQREAIELAYYGGLTQPEIAQMVDAPLGTVKTRTRDGLERLRGLLRPLIAPDAETRDP